MGEGARSKLTVGEQIKQQRLSMELTVDRMAELTGISADRINQIEAETGDKIGIVELGQLRLCGIDLNFIADELGVSSEFNLKSEQQIVEEFLPGVPYNVFNDATKGLSPEQKGEILLELLFNPNK